MKKIFLFIISPIVASQIAVAQNVGIGTANPLARLHVTEGNVLLSSTGDVPAVPGNPPVQGSGRRIMWYADKAAFRAGYVNGNYWDKINTGNYSFAAGYNTTAGGYGATALGNGTAAIGIISTAFGRNTIAFGEYSTAMGNSTTASGFVSTALGDNSEAFGDYSTAMGRFTTASGNSSTAMGNYVSTNNQEGCFIIGDNSTTTVLSTFTPNQFRARFAGGYRLYTSSDNSSSCFLGPGDNAWTTGSSIHIKENFAEVNGEDFLRKISAFHLTSWNYKKQDPRTFRHYGPMAQDFYAAFGKDKYGTIGNDTTINSADFAGVSFIAIQALEKRTVLQQQQITELQAVILQLKKELDELKKNKELHY